MSQSGRCEILEMPGRWTVVDLAGERVADPRRSWSRTDAELVVDVLAERAGVSIPHARRLLREKLAAGPEDGRRPHLLPAQAAAPAAAAEQEA